MQQHAAPRGETLSALLDNEVSELDARRLLRDMTDEDAEQLGRWQLARDVLQRHPVAAVPADFSARIGMALEQEQQSRHWALPLARLAVAASVALATVVGWQYWDDSQLAGAPAVASSQRPVLLEGHELVSGVIHPQAQPAALTQERERMEDMLVRHSDFAARHGSQSVVPYARFISLEARKEQQ
ncbi:MAG: sigma-E factor negative regulatory protein [Alcanivoracaceae bacterium]|nr:sigma-E factor negative regulatory protein [Alcanivoracaceae bacterium]